jgi:peptidoglycan hydrolase-like protein with peptidoglycan-binding domain
MPPIGFPTAPTAPPAPAAAALRDPRLAGSPPLVEVAAGTRTLALGERGGHVDVLLDALRAAGYGVGLATTPGVFDRALEGIVARFQRDRNLPPSGIVDAATLAALDAALASGPAAAPRPSGRPSIPTAPAAAPSAPPTTSTAPAAPLAADPLAGRLYMDKTTFANMPPYQWARDAVELEVVNGVTGVEPAKLLDALRSTNAAGRTAYQRLRKSDSSEAFTLGYSGMGLDEMRWDADAHRMREKNKYVSLTIESGRYEPDPRTGVRELSLGTDKMDDTYYDTKDFDLTKNDISVRGRARWDTDTEIRRILIGVKVGSEIDEFGIKRAAKTDVRNDGASKEEIALLDADVRTGTTHWDGRAEAVKPLKGVYDALAAKGLLPDVGPHEGVLELEPKVHIRSIRSRFHLNETDLGSMQKLYAECGAPRLQMVLDLAARTRAAGGLAPADAAALDKLEAGARGILDLSAVARAAEARLKAIDPGMAVTPDSIRPFFPDQMTGGGWNRPQRTYAEIEKGRVIAETLDELYHGFAEDLDAARRVLCRSQDRTFEDYPDLFVAWSKAQDDTLRNKTTFDPFLKRYDEITARGGADLDAAVRSFNEYGAQQKAAGDRKFRNFQPLTADGWKALRPQIENEVVRVAERQLEEAGSMARGLWFEEARRFYVPGAQRNTGNFIIDTLDMSEYVTEADWQAIPEAERTPASEIPKDRIFHATLVNENQIELGLEKPYLDRISALSKEIGVDRASLVMKWMTAARRPDVDPANVATYGVALATIQQQAPAALDATVAEINAFLKQQGSALRPLTAADLRRIDPNDLTASNRDAPVRTDPERERLLDGALFVFQQYLDVQKGIVAAKGEKILRVLRDAGAPRGIGFEPTAESKGGQALAILAGIR